MQLSGLSVSLLTFCLALVGCATVDLDRDLATLQDARACCASAADLPRPVPAREKIDVVFDATTPHFDFGAGLLPFLRVAVNPSSAKLVALLSYPPSAGFSLIGSGVHYVAARIEFFDASGNSLGVPEMTPPVMKTHGPFLAYAYLRYVQVPENSAFALISVSKEDLGRKGQISGQVAGGGMMLGSTFIPMAGGGVTIPYTLVPYGKLVVVFADKPLR
jgi:hypothetical protein